MIAARRGMFLSLVLGLLLLLIVAATALAGHRRVGSGTPFRVSLVPDMQQCTSPNTTHAAPLNLAACSSVRITSEILTMSPRGVSSGFLKMTVFCTDGADPPCNPTNGTDTEDLGMEFFQSDVLCAVGGVLGCTAAGADYTGPLVVRSSLRITDHANGSPPAACTNGPGDPPCVPATVQDTNWSFLAGCTATPNSPNGSTCQTNTTMDTLVPNTVKEFQRALVSVLSTGAFDMGPDGAVGGGCPPSCGTGDETRYLQQTILTP